MKEEEKETYRMTEKIKMQAKSKKCEDKKKM